MSPLIRKLTNAQRQLAIDTINRVLALITPTAPSTGSTLTLTAAETQLVNILGEWARVPIHQVPQEFKPIYRAVCLIRQSANAAQ